MEPVQVSTDVALAPLTTLGLGGPAARLMSAATEGDLVQAVLDADAAGEQVLLLGGGSNLVLPDAGVGGLVVLIRTRGVERSDGPDGTCHLTVAAGEPWDDLVTATVADGLAGMEALAGIPGLTGATPVQNVGAYGQDVGQTLVGVRALDRHAGAVQELTAQDCDLGYRSSRFKTEPGRWVVLAATFRLRPGGTSTPVRYAELARRLGVEVGGTVPLADVRDAVLALRSSKGMVVDPADPDTASAGSFFTNPVLTGDEVDALRRRSGADVPGYAEPDGRTKVPAAWLIDRAGYGKGFGAGLGTGRARVSSKHALALTNRGGATTAELLTLARTIRDGVREQLGVELVNEPVLVEDRL